VVFFFPLWQINSDVEVNCLENISLKLINASNIDLGGYISKCKEQLIRRANERKLYIIYTVALLSLNACSVIVSMQIAKRIASFDLEQQSRLYYIEGVKNVTSKIKKQYENNQTHLDLDTQYLKTIPKFATMNI